MSFCLEDFVKDKRVVIVGPAKSINDTKQGKFIDSFDIVVRFNNSIPINKQNNEDVGIRTDILCSCLEEHRLSGGDIKPELWKNEGVKWVLSAYPKELWYVKNNYNEFVRRNRGAINHHVVELDFFEGLEEELGTRPTTGYLGITYLLSMNIKELYVTGITFCSDGYAKGYKDSVDDKTFKKISNSNIHSQEPAEIHFKKLCFSDERIILDDFLKEKFSP
jgi:hypothetical protein